MSGYIIGMDLGGTNLPCAVLDEDHNILARYEEPTRKEEGVEAVLERMAHCTKMVIEKAGLKADDILAMGIGAPGPLDGRTGIILEAPNLGWENIHIAKIIKEKTGVEVFLENDANAAGYGEYWAGAGVGCQHMLMMTLGTGVGGAVIVDGNLLCGPDWTAGELGHVVVVDGGRECNCGSKGCIEAYASATATVERFIEARARGWKTSLVGNDVSCADIFNAAASGDALASNIVDETGRYLGVIVGSMANLLNSERCVISGGMIKAGDVLFDAIKKACVEHAFNAPGKRIEILPAQLGSDAGVIGAAGCALVNIKKKSN